MQVIPGVGPDAPTTTNARGGKQSHSPYACHLLPPRALLHVAAILKAGAEKYGVDNWKNLPPEDHANHALTHLFAHAAGDVSDDHAGHAACRLLMWLEMLLERGGQIAHP